MGETGHWIPVVALALQDAGGRVLLQERPPEKHHGGLWEFPGGKVDPGETPRSALVREIAEELAIVLDPADCEPWLLADEPREGAATLVLMLFRATRWQGEPRGLEGQRWGWFTRAEASALPLAPMDRALLERFSD